MPVTIDLDYIQLNPLNSGADANWDERTGARDGGDRSARRWSVCFSIFLNFLFFFLKQYLLLDYLSLPRYHLTAHGITMIANLRDLLIQKKKGKTWKKPLQTHEILPALLCLANQCNHCLVSSTKVSIYLSWRTYQGSAASYTIGRLNEVLVATTPTAATTPAWPISPSLSVITVTSTIISSNPIPTSPSQNDTIISGILPPPVYYPSLSYNILMQSQKHPLSSQNSQTPFSMPRKHVLFLFRTYQQHLCSYPLQTRWISFRFWW